MDSIIVDSLNSEELADFIDIDPVDVDRVYWRSSVLLAKTIGNMGYVISSVDGVYRISSKGFISSQPRCENCGKFIKFTKVELKRLPTKSIVVCPDCNHLHPCPICKNYLINSNQDCCNSCKSDMVCVICGDYGSQSVSTSDGRKYICDKKSCQNHICFWCDNNLSETEEGLCVECEDNSRISMHGPKWGPSKFKKISKNYEKDPVYYGVELEVDGGNNRREALKRIRDVTPPYIWGTCDCTLSSSGIELTTLPMTIEAHKNFPWEQLQCVLEDLNYTDNSNSGLHIHMSRNRLTNIQQIKIGLFWYANKNFIEKFSRRKMEGHCPGKSWKSCLSKRKGYRYGGKYGYNSTSGYRNSVNFGSSTGIEFRQFNGTWEAEVVLSAIQFLDTLRNFCKQKGGSYLVSQKALNDFKKELENTKHKELHDYYTERVK